jgi:hypothetical protein
MMAISDHPRLMTCTENQSSCTDCQIFPSRHQLLVRTDHHLNAVRDFHHLQRNKSATTPQQPSTVGREPEDMAPSLAHQHRIYHVGGLHLGLLLILEGWSQTCRKDIRLLLCFRRRVLHLQHRHVGHRRRCTPGLQVQLQQQGHVGMVMRRQPAQAPVRKRNLLRPDLPPAKLESCMHHHRDRRRDHHHRSLRHRLLPLLLQEPTAQIHGRPRPRSLRHVPRAAALTIRPEHSRPWSSEPARRRLQAVCSRLRQRSICRRRRRPVRRCNPPDTAQSLPTATTAHPRADRDAQDDPSRFHTSGDRRQRKIAHAVSACARTRPAQSSDGRDSTRAIPRTLWRCSRRASLRRCPDSWCLPAHESDTHWRFPEMILRRSRLKLCVKVTCVICSDFLETGEVRGYTIMSVQITFLSHMSFLPFP